MEFAKELGWDLLDCVVALGKDNKFHLYNETGPFWKNGEKDWPMSSTRAYFQKTQNSPWCAESYSITPFGCS